MQLLECPNMAAILEIPEVRRRVSPISVSEYHRLDERNENGRRTELVRGIVIEKMSKSPLHSSIAKWLYDKFIAVLPSGFVVRRADPLALPDSEPEPDLAVVRGSPEQFFSTHPATAELVIEVAVSSPALDRENASLYAEANIKEYWIVLAEERQIEVYRQPEKGRYHETHVYEATETIQCVSLPGVRVCLSELFPDQR